MIVGEHTVSSKMVVCPFKDLHMVPAVHASDQNVLESLLNSFLHVSENIRDEKVLLSAKHVLEEALLTVS